MFHVDHMFYLRVEVLEELVLVAAATVLLAVRPEVVACHVLTLQTSKIKVTLVGN